MENLNLRWFSLVNAPVGLSHTAIFAATALAEWVIFLVPLSLLWLWLRSEPHAREATIRACMAAILGLLINQAIGLLWFHPRPFMAGIGQNYLVHVADSSFPSDHVTIMTAVGVTLLKSAPRAVRQWGMKLLATVPVVGWARVFLGVHYPFDILGAIVIGTLAAVCAQNTAMSLISTRLATTAEWLYRRILARPIARGWLRA